MIIYFLLEFSIKKIKILGKYVTWKRIDHIKDSTLLCERMSDFCFNVHKVFWRENTGNLIIKSSLIIILY